MDQNDTVEQSEENNIEDNVGKKNKTCSKIFQKDFKRLKTLSLYQNLIRNGSE